MLVESRLPLMGEGEHGSAQAEAHGGVGVFIGFCMSCMFSQYALVSFLSPFLPGVAAEHGLSQTMVGVVMGMDSLASCFVSPIVGFQTARVGVRTMISAGLAISAMTCWMVGCVPMLCKEATSMAIAFIGVRFLMGVGGAMVETAAYGSMLQACREQKGMVMAASEMMTGLGCIAGPPVGGLLFQFGGSFWLPCVVFSAFPVGLLLACLVVRMPMAEAGAAEADETRRNARAVALIVGAAPKTLGATPPPSPSPSVARLLGVLTSASFAITLFGVVLSSSALGFIDPVLAPYVKATYGLDAAIAGIFFMIAGLVYILTSTVVGALVDSFGGVTAPRQESKLKLTTTAGFVMLALGYLFLAPAFGRDALERLAVFTPSLVVIGIGLGLTILPSMSDLSAIATSRLQPTGEAEEAALSTQVSGLFSSAYALGQVVGPIGGGALDSAVGVNAGCFVFALVCALGVVLNGFGAWRAWAPSATMHVADA